MCSLLQMQLLHCLYNVNIVTKNRFLFQSECTIMRIYVTQFLLFVDKKTTSRGMTYKLINGCNEGSSSKQITLNTQQQVLNPTRKKGGDGTRGLKNLDLFYNENIVYIYIYMKLWHIYIHPIVYLIYNSHFEKVVLIYLKQLDPSTPGTKNLALI